MALSPISLTKAKICLIIDLKNLVLRIKALRASPIKISPFPSLKVLNKPRSGVQTVNLGEMIEGF
jgi:hypothetical protein